VKRVLIDTHVFRKADTFLSNFETCKNGAALKKSTMRHPSN